MHSNTGSETGHCIESDTDDKDNSFALNREYNSRKEGKLALEEYIMKHFGCGVTTNRPTTNGKSVEFVCAGVVEPHFIIKDGKRIGAGKKLRVPQGFVEPERQPDESETQYQRRRSNDIRKAAACPFRAVLRRKIISKEHAPKKKYVWVFSVLGSGLNYIPSCRYLRRQDKSITENGRKFNNRECYC